MKINNFKTKILALSLTVITSFSALSACRPKEDNGIEQVDTTKTQLNVGVFNDGTGAYWLEEAKKDFEAYYAEKSFEKGKKGVQIVIDPQKDRFKSDVLISTMKSTENNGNTLYVVPTNQKNFYNENLIVDITDAVTEKVYDDNGDYAPGANAKKSIIDFMYPEYLKDLKIDGKYYSVPWRTYFWGVTYDADLFNEKSLFIKKNGDVGAKQKDILTQNCSTGPDGVYGTSDDGMPNDWNTFIKLINAMVSKNVIPFTWSYQENYQRREFFNCVWANYEGANDFSLNYSFSGTDSQFGEINENNYGKLISQEGRRAALKACKDVTSRKEYYSSRVKSNNYTDAQYEYAHSIADDKPIAMLFEGSYWEVEAKGTFDKMAVFNSGYGYGKRNFKWLPMPNFTDVDGIANQDTARLNEAGKYDRVLNGTSGKGTGFYISKKNKFDQATYDTQVEIAKLFIQFVHSRKQLANFTKNTGGAFRPFNFTISDEELNEWPGVAKSIYVFIKEGATIVDETMNSSVRNNNPTRFAEGAWSFDHGDWKDAIHYFLDRPDDTVNGCFTYVERMLRSSFGHYE